MSTNIFKTSDHLLKITVYVHRVLYHECKLLRYHIPWFDGRERLHTGLAHNLLPAFFAPASHATALGRCALTLQLPSEIQIT